MWLSEQCYCFAIVSKVLTLCVINLNFSIMHDEIIKQKLYMKVETAKKLHILRGRAAGLMYTKLPRTLKAAKTFPKLAPYE